MTHDPDPFRRRLLQALAALPLGGLAAPVWAQEGAAAAGLITPNVCMIQPETTEGPFYLDPRLVRRDITEGKAGVPMELAVQVVTADCRPVAGARVDIWHCDAQGVYSGYAREGSAGETFLRGTQIAGVDGVATFDTIWPGWYPGRTTHFHYKVILDARTVLTSQIFLPDGLSDTVYATDPAYAGRRGARRVFNGNDGIARRAGDGARAEVREVPGGYAAKLVAGVAAGG